MTRFVCTIFLLLLAIVVDPAAAQQGAEQVQNRVHEKVDSFMRIPVNAVQVWEDFYELGGFPNDLKGIDRDITNKYLISMATGLAFSKMDPYYGLEDGTFIILDGPAHSTYREPGDGYDPNDSEMQKYWNACVDQENGNVKDCVIDPAVNANYVSCINDCELIRCADPDSQKDCTLIVDQMGREECESKIKWCKNYIIEKAEEGGAEIGFVPFTYHCMNSERLFSQTPGEVLTTTESGVELGDCTFKNGALVTRRLEGPYAYCGNDGEWCDTTYLGTYRSLDYDARWRGWYIQTRAFQTKFWTAPYIFFDLGEMGITYAAPIFSFSDDGRTVFNGVLAVDYTLQAISDFLEEDFQSTPYSVGIYEDEGENFLIALSTGSPITKDVLKDDPSKPCSEAQLLNDECTKSRISITKLHVEGNTATDIALRNAHFVWLEEGFASDDGTVIVRESEDVGSLSYLSSSILYEQPNIKWRVLVVVPLGRNPEDTITEEDGLFIILCVFAGLGCVICFSFFVIFFHKRNEKVLLLSDWRFTAAFIFACALLNLSSFALLGENSDKLCSLRMWSFYMLSSMALSAIFVKAFRTFWLLGTTANDKGHKMNNWQAFLRFWPIVLLQGILLTVIQLVDPPITVETVDSVAGVPTQGLHCGHESNAFIITQGIFDLILIVVGCALAYMTRNIDPRFGDAKALMFAMYNIAFTVLMLTMIFAIVDVSDSARRVMQTIGVFWATVFSSAGFVVPALLEAEKEKRETLRRLTTARQRIAKRTSSVMPGISTVLNQDSSETLKILVCTANMGNAKPTISSMKAWVPENGACEDVKLLDGGLWEIERFDLIVIGMQESTWSAKKKDKDEDEEKDTMSLSMSMQSDIDEVLAAVEGEDTVTLRKMVKAILGKGYSCLAEEQRGQMRMHVWASDEVAPFMENIRITGANTGIGNVLANKGGIIVTLDYLQTRISFLTAHLAAHEGANHYKSRCENVFDILQKSKGFNFSKKGNISFDCAISSHYMFVLGDLNFRTKFDGDNEHEDNVNRAMELIEAKDWETLYSFDELHKGVTNGDLLVDFKTPPCNFYPTFKVEREAGFVYKKQRTPSYTDRILYKGAHGHRDYLKPLAYEPCVDFITSDHKPVRGAFSLLPNECIDPSELHGKVRMTFREMECSNLQSADVDGYSDPYVMFAWDDSAALVDDSKGTNVLSRLFAGKSWPKTKHIPKTLKPSWKGEEISLLTTNSSVAPEAMLFIAVMDYDFGTKDDLLGVLALSLKELTRMHNRQLVKEVDIDQPLEYHGKHFGRIKFKLELSIVIG